MEVLPKIVLLYALFKFSFQPLLIFKKYSLLQDLKDNWKEILSMEVPPDTATVLELEKEAASYVEKTVWDVASLSKPVSRHVMKNQNEDSVAVGNRTSTSNGNIVIALAVLFLAFFAGLWLAYFKF